MAMVKRAGPISNITGKQGGIIYREDQCGPHIQAFPRLIGHEPTLAQKNRRKAFRRLISELQKFSPFQAADWQAYANAHPKKNKKGEVITLTWWTAFVGYNINRVVAGKDIVLYPPW